MAREGSFLPSQPSQGLQGIQARAKPVRLKQESDMTAPLTPADVLRLRLSLLAGLATGAIATFRIDDARRMMLAAPDVFYRADAFALTRATLDTDELPLEARTVHRALSAIAGSMQDVTGPWPQIIDAEAKAAAIMAKRRANAPPMAEPGKFIRQVDARSTADADQLADDQRSSS